MDIWIGELAGWRRIAFAVLTVAGAALVAAQPAASHPEPTGLG
jgi:drug/metabolite transporter (DMT)-like permease